MLNFYMKANDIEEKDSFQIFGDNGKPIYYTKDDFLSTGHRIKIFLADTISEVAYVQEKTTRYGSRFEFCAHGDQFGNVQLDTRFTRPEISVSFNNWRFVGRPGSWDYEVFGGSVRVLQSQMKQYLIPGQALNMTDTAIVTVDSDPDALISLAFVLAVWATNKYTSPY